MSNIGDQLHQQMMDKTKNHSVREVGLVMARQADLLTEDERFDELVNMRRDVMRHRPRNSEELHQMVKALYKINIPVTSTHPDYNSPFEYFAKIWFSRDEDAVALAARGGGKTLLTSIFADSSAGFFPKLDIVHAGGTQVQAQVASGYLEEFHGQPPLDERFMGKPAAFTARYRNRSKWKIVTGSMKGVSGQHPAILTLDEIEFWDIEAITQTFEVPVNKNGYKRRWLAFSTRQRSYGAMNWLVDEAPKRGFKFYQWTAFEMMRPCRTCVAIDQEPHGNDDARSKACILWKACKGERARKASGWLSLREAQQKCIRLGGPDGREWQTQGLCQRPSSHGLVLHNFEKVYGPGGNYSRWTYIKELPWYAVHDPAEGKKSVILFVQDYEGKSYVFDELVDQQCADVTQAKKDFWEHCERMGYSEPDIVVVDPHRTDAVATWKQGSKSGVGILKKYNADTPDISEKGTGQLLRDTLELTRRHICDGNYVRRIFINPDYCPFLDRAISEYHYPTDNVTNEITSETPDKAYSDEIDPVRYWVMYKETKFREGRARLAVLSG
jgi:hypothetical protein